LGGEKFGVADAAFAGKSDRRTARSYRIALIQN
jgi:hypothetical protein